MRADAQEKPHMDTESSDIGSGFTAHPENTQVAVVVELDNSAFVDGTDTKLTLNGGNQRGPLKKSTGQGFKGTRKLCLAAGELVMETDLDHRQSLVR